MTSDESALLAAILANPGDDLPRLVLADWLDEHVCIGVCPRCNGAGWYTEIGPNTFPQDCQSCSGLGRVGNNNADRAEFIRVQCELANADWRKCGGYYCHTHDTGNTTHVDCRPEKLRIRESELWPRVVGSIDVPGEGWLIDIHPRGTDRSAIVRRGFVAEVRCPLATLFGGECGREDAYWFGSRHVVSNPSTRHRSSAIVLCPDCHGTSHTPGIAGGLFRAQPIERVILTDREPWKQSVAPRYAGWWQESPYHQGTDVLPDELLRHMDDHPKRIDHSVSIRYRLTNPVRGGRVLFASHTDALEALSAACVAWGRELAGLAPVPPGQPVLRR